MQIKAADDKQPQLDVLTALLARPDVDAAIRRRIETEIRKVRAGAAGERDAAYEIEFHFGAESNRVTIHDFRLEVDGRVAQIDHLIIDRVLTGPGLDELGQVDSAAAVPLPEFVAADAQICQRLAELIGAKPATVLQCGR